MSTVKYEPFFFSEEEQAIQIQPDKLPGAVAPDVKKEEKPENIEAKPKEEVKVEKTETPPFVDPEEEIEVEEPFFNPSKEEKKEEKVEVDKVTADAVDYKALSEFLIESEVWKDFEGRDEIELDEESFKALWKAQADNAAKEFLQEERSQFGGTANQLIDYLKSGGTVDDFVSNYTQQIDAESLDTESAIGAETTIKQYYKSLGWNDAKIKKHIDRLKDSGDEDLIEEAKDCKTGLIQAIEEERQEMIRQQDQIARDRKARAEAFNKAVRDNLYKDESLVDRDKKEIDQFVYNYKHEDKQTGQRYSDFMIKMSEINQDPKKYAKFIKMIKNFDTYEDKTTTENKVKKETFNFLKKGTTLEGVEGIQPIKEKKDPKAPPAFKFK